MNFSVCCYAAFIRSLSVALISVGRFVSVSTVHVQQQEVKSVISKINLFIQHR